MLFPFFPSPLERAGSLGLREQTLLSDTKSMIMNLQLMSLIDLPYKIDHFERVKAEFQKIDTKYDEFLKYFEHTWVKGQYFKLSDWDYFKALNEEGKDVEMSKIFNITNNAVESCYVILNSCLSRGKISTETFEGVLNTVIAIYEGERNSKEKKIRTEDKKNKTSELLFFFSSRSS